MPIGGSAGEMLMGEKIIPYGRQFIDAEDVQAVVSCLESGWLTTGPAVERFERKVADRVRAGYGVAFSSGSTALMGAVAALGLGPGDEVITTPITFAATANCILNCGAKPVFADVLPDSLLIDPQSVESLVTPATKAIFAVDYAGQPCDYPVLRAIADKNGLTLLSDCCHGLGSEQGGLTPAQQADITIYSFHPVKAITTGEGGMLVSDDAEIAAAAASFRNHGITSDFKKREHSASYVYDIERPGGNYRLSDIHCALGCSQLDKLDFFLRERERIAGIYDEVFSNFSAVAPLRREPGHANHLYVVRVDNAVRDDLFRLMRSGGIMVNVHYLPVHLMTLYRCELGAGEGLCPVAEKAAKEILSLPIFPGLTAEEQNRVVDVLKTGLTQLESGK